jgi:hypothetical protein
MRIKKQIERWFEVPDDPDKAQIQIKHLNPGEVADIMDGVFKQTIVYRTDDDGDSQPELTQETDKRKDREMTLTASVVNWKKFFDRDGNKLKCTPENVIRASREIEGFDALVTEFRNRLAQNIAKVYVNENKDLDKILSNG